MPDGNGIDEEKRATLRRFAAGATLPIAAVPDAVAADRGRSVARDGIAGYLSRTPGAHFSKIRDDLSLGTGETQHHLDRLEGLGAVESHRDGDYRRFFPANRFDTYERTVLGYLRRDTPRGMLVELLQRPGATTSDIAAALDVSPPTVSKHAGELDEAGILSRSDGYVVEHPETVLLLLVRYADSFDERTLALAREAADLIVVRRPD